MIISHQRRAIFFHNPKCAGTSVRRALQPFHDDPVRFRGIQAVPFLMNDMDHSHLRLWELQLLYPHIMEAARSYRSAILVRNPYHRFVSAVDEHYKVFQPSVPFAAMTPEQQTETVETFLERGLTIERVLANFRFIHFSPQLWFIRLGDQRIPTNILPLDDQGHFADGIFACFGVASQPLPRENPSRRDLSHLFGSAQIMEFVRKFYAMDFWFLASEPSLRHLTREPR